uniref:Putative secreted protein ovary overexpressed n=1 Tax=Rhipicephalus microplus TaxID=6941 RepID=A0A6M2DD43_RHIMP
MFCFFFFFFCKFVTAAKPQNTCQAKLHSSLMYYYAAICEKRAPRVLGGTRKKRRNRQECSYGDSTPKSMQPAAVIPQLLWPQLFA